jgi:hypothetical protein
MDYQHQHEKMQLIRYYMEKYEIFRPLFYLFRQLSYNGEVAVSSYVLSLMIVSYFQIQ